jgi:putative PIN family toxin of toxin-antitoxin system
MLRAVFDTNILFSATGWRGSPYHCLALARSRKIVLVLAREILIEYHQKLQTKLAMTPGQATRAVAEILSCSTRVAIKNQLSVITADPDDDKVLECAVTGQVDYIVSGDRHLLDRKEYEGIPIVRASEFLSIVSTKME